jgi:hypothetical protein
MPRARCIAAYPTMVKAQEIKALTTLGQVRDPRLGRFELKAKLSQDRRERRKRPLGLRPCSAHDQQIVRVADQHARAAVCPLPVEPVQVNVGQTG